VSRFTVDANRSALGGDSTINDHQTNADATSLSRLKRPKQIILPFG
jgi:hypothetical protein